MCVRGTILFDEGEGEVEEEGGDEGRGEETGDVTSEGRWGSLIPIII